MSALDSPFLPPPFQVDLPVRALFEAPSVAGFAECIEEARRDTHLTKAPPLEPVPRDRPILASFAQQRLWFLEQLNPAGATYNLPAAVRLTGQLDVDALAKSLEEMLRRHETLRTTFAMVDGQPVQVVAPPPAMRLPIVDLRHFPWPEREAEARRLATEEARRGFDLERGPMMRAVLLWLREDEHVLLFTIHHIVSDAWSQGVLNREISALYHARVTRSPSPLPELPVQYADFAHWQHEWLRGEVLETQLAYWKKQLGGMPPLLLLPADRPRPPRQTFQGAREPVFLPDSLCEGLRSLGRQEGATMYMTLLAAFQAWLFRISGQEDIAVGSPSAGRTRTELEGLVGFFVNTLVLRTDLSGNPTFRDLLGRVREVTLEAYAHQDAPFEKLVEELKPERDLSHSPLFQVMLVLQNTPAVGMALPGISSSMIDFHSGTTKFDLLLSLESREQGLAGTLEYSTDLFDAATVVRWLSQFQMLLENAMSRPDMPISALQLLPEIVDAANSDLRFECGPF